MQCCILHSCCFWNVYSSPFQAIQTCDVFVYTLTKPDFPVMLIACVGLSECTCACVYKSVWMNYGIECSRLKVFCKCVLAELYAEFPNTTLTL